MPVEFFIANVFIVQHSTSYIYGVPRKTSKLRQTCAFYP